MNANELADELENRHQWKLLNHIHWSEKAATMLRQQQAEIEALKKQLDTRTRELIGASFYEHDYKTMMANNEPVAWWTGEFNDEADDFMFDKTKQNHMNHINSRTHEFFPIPLYTHPVKELTDEEITEIVADKYEKGHGRYIDTDLFFIEFARAILRKAQEK
jgi:uncharacterized protein involved in tolerance to divalent cations